MAYTQLVHPRLGTRDGTGWCLRFTQSVYGAPARHNSAWDAWNATKKKHRNRNLPNASVPVWFEHFGTYGSPPTWGNWGHVVAYVPGRGFLSSPAGGFGQQWFSSIEAVERTFNARFVGWSEDLNGLLVVRSTGSNSTTQKGIEVKRYSRKGLAGGRKLQPGQHLYLNTANWHMNQATNVVGGVGEYVIFPHVYLRGKPGDSVIVNLMWQDTRATPRRNSNHYQERITFDETGTLDAEGLSVARRNLAFSRAVPRGYAVYVRVESEKTNRGPVAIDLLTCDALLIK